MIDLENEDVNFPNTQVIRDLLRSLNYVVIPLDIKVRRKVSDYSAICFSAWITQFDQIKQTHRMFFCMDDPTLTEEQSIFIFDILVVFFGDFIFI